MTPMSHIAWPGFPHAVPSYVLMPDPCHDMQAWPELQLRLVGGAGHSQYDPAIQHELLEATDAMRNRAWAQPAPQLQAALY
jgi:hypothetical protein